MRQTNRRHDLIAVHIADPRESELPDLGIVALEDAETGEIVEIDTSSAAIRRRFKEGAAERARQLISDFRAEGVDTLPTADGQTLYLGAAALLQESHAAAHMIRPATAFLAIVVAASFNVAAPAARADQAAAAQPAVSPPSAGPGAAAAAAKPTPDLAAPSPEYAEDIREIRGPKYVFPTYLVEIAALVLAVALALAYGIWRWTKRARPTRALLPFELALKNLEAIRPLMQPATVREFSIEVSDIVRRYIEERFDVTAAHRTTEEFLHDLLTSTQATLAKHRKLLGEFLEAM